MTRILVIDDDESVCIAIERLLRHNDCIAILANSSRLGAEAFDASNFDLAMIDIFMPEMDGLETIKDFRKRAPAVPIVAMSGFRFRNTMAPTPDFLGMAAELGATYCLRKPFGPQQLMAAVNACLGKKSQGSCVAEA
jgi:DNA-binding response OmpR family regulator